MKLNNLFSLENKVVIIFGGNGYLGSNFNEALLKYGAKVYSCDIKNIRFSYKKRKKSRCFNKHYYNENK